MGSKKRLFGCQLYSTASHYLHNNRNVFSTSLAHIGPLGIHGNVTAEVIRSWEVSKEISRKATTTDIPTQ
jgi:hypothetical protein